MIVEVPGVGNIEFPDTMSAAEVSAALAQYANKTPIQTIGPNPDGTYGQVPEGFVLNPATGQMEDLRSPNNPNMPPNDAIGAFAIGGGKGAMFAGADEAYAAAKAATGGDYDYELARAREIDRRAAEEHPLAYYAGVIPGAANSALMAWRAAGAPASTGALWGRGGLMAQGAKMGGIEGLLWGALEGEGAQGRAANAVKTGLMGAAVGGAAPAVVAAGAKAARAIADPIMGALNTGNLSRAQRAMMDTVRRSGMSVDDVSREVSRAAAEGQPEFRTMDALGIAGQRRASGVARAGGDGAEEIAQYLAQRQLDQPNRVASFIDDAFGTGGTTAAKTEATLNAARKATNNVNYEAARAGAAPVNLNDAIDTIDDLMKRNPVVGESALVKTEAGKRLAAIRAKLRRGGSQLIDFDGVLNVKEDLGQLIGRIKKANEEVPHSLAKVYGEIDAALEAASEGYRAANDAARAGRAVVAAVDSGADMARPGARYGDTTAAFSAMTPEEQIAARVGYGDRVLAGIEANKSPTANVAKAFNSTKARQEAAIIAENPELFLGRIGRENAMWGTQNRALGGSRTADNLSDVADLGAAKSLALAARDFFTGNWSGAASNAGAAIGPALTGNNPATRGLIAEMLMSSDPKKALAAALRRDMLNQSQKRAVEGLLRAIGREATP